MRDQSHSLLSQHGVQNQAILPLRTAVKLSMQGIRTRFGRSVVTLIGVGLGIAFLMSVLAGFHIKQGLRDQAEIHRAVERRISVLRSEIGMLERRTVLLAGKNMGDEDVRFIGALERQRARVSVLRGGDPLFPPGLPVVDGPDAVEGLDAMLLLGAPDSHVRDVIGAAAMRACPVIMFDQPDADFAAGLAAAGVALRVLSIRLRPDEIERAEQREIQQRMRMYWVVVVSLLITVGGITNAMLMSVTERFREIATMKCLGALSGFVVKLFLIESSLIGFGGSLLGALIGLVLPLLAYSYTFGFGLVVGAVDGLSLAGFMVGCVLAGMVLAVISGIYPARVAARMIPADALRTQV